MRDRKIDDENSPGDYQNTIWCYTGRNEGEWDYCTPKPKVECPNAGIVLTTNPFDRFRRKAYCIGQFNHEAQILIESDSQC